LDERQRQRSAMDALKPRLAHVEKDIGNMMAVIEAGILTTTTNSELETAEAERDRLVATLNVDTK
jgi:hypothetical protein